MCQGQACTLMCLASCLYWSKEFAQMWHLNKMSHFTPCFSLRCFVNIVGFMKTLGQCSQLYLSAVSIMIASATLTLSWLNLFSSMSLTFGRGFFLKNWEERVFISSTYSALHGLLGLHTHRKFPSFLWLWRSIKKRKKVLKWAPLNPFTFLY